MKHIILEGENGTGKTTIANGLLNANPNRIYHHFSFPQGDTNEDRAFWQKAQFSMFFDVLKEVTPTPVKYICDRSYVGEHYWSLKFRKIRPTYLWEMEKEYANLPAIIVNVVADPEEIHGRLIKRGETAYIEEIIANQNGIAKFCSQSIFPTYTVNTSRHSIDECIAQVLEAENDK